MCLAEVKIVEYNNDCLFFFLLRTSCEFPRAGFRKQFDTNIIILILLCTIFWCFKMILFLVVIIIR